MLEIDNTEALVVPCPYCGAPKGEPCTVGGGGRWKQDYSHAMRWSWALKWHAWHGDRAANRRQPPLEQRGPGATEERDILGET